MIISKSIRNFVVVIILMFSIPTFGQDIIIKKNGDEFKAKVIEVGKSELKYKKYENLNGPTYLIDIADVFMVRYENGTKDVFSSDSSKSSSEEVPLKKDEVNEQKNNIIQTGIDIGKAALHGNKYVFINSVPISKYEVVFSFSNGMLNSAIANPSAIAEYSIKNANLEAAQQGKLYDAILVSDKTERDIAIKFINPSDDFSLCRVKKINGVLSFIGCEPTLAYKVTGLFFQIHEVGTNPIWGNYNASYPFYVNKAVDWGRRKKVAFDAVIYCNLNKCNDMLIKY